MDRLRKGTGCRRRAEGQGPGTAREPHTQQEADHQNGGAGGVGEQQAQSGDAASKRVSQQALFAVQRLLSHHRHQASWANTWV